MLKVAGLSGSAYGSSGLRWRLLLATEHGLDLTLNVFSGTPSWTSVMLGAGVTVGRDYRLGARAARGVAASPAPNQRPMGPNAILSATTAG